MISRPVEILRDTLLIRTTLPVCASEGYLKSTSRNYGWFSSSEFILPFFILNRTFSRQIIFTSGPVKKIAECPVKKEKAFLSEVVDLCRKMDIDCIGQPKTTALFNTYPDGAVHMPWGCYQADLSQDEDALFSRFHSNRRRVIRKAKRDSVQIHCGPENIHDCHHLIHWTLTRQGRPGIKLRQLKTYQENLPQNVSFYLASHKQSNHACAVLIHDRETAYYIHGGSCTTPHHGAASLLHWTAMMDMKNKGLKCYNFVGGRIHPVKGSKQESIQIFKSRFGTVFKKGFLWKYPLKPWKQNLSGWFDRFRGNRTNPYYYEDIIDNELRTETMEKSSLINNSPAPE